MDRMASGQDDDSVLVPTITIDTIAEELELVPDVIKIDVEGAEIEVLRGAERTLTEARPTIFLSTHSPELRGLSLKLLTTCGYNTEPLLSSDDPHEFVAKPAK